MTFTKISIGIVCIALIAWIVRVAITPAPGVRINDLGREHVGADVVEKTVYNSNPPTSGPHLLTWVKPGVYDVPQQDGELLHSLEHGYVIIQYNCGVHEKAQRIVPVAFAHEEGEAASEASTLTTTPIATGSAINESPSCKALIGKLETLAKAKKLFKLIVVPRPQLDTTIALTAWDYIDKFDTFDAKRIERFIDYHRDHGPEQTME